MTQPQRIPTTLTASADVLAEAVRRLVEVTVRTQASGDSVLASAAAIDAVTALLDVDLRTGPWVPDQSDPQPSPYNAVVGTGNPVAPPVQLTTRTVDGVTGTVTFRSAYEGAPGLVHGGMLALVLDQLFGEAGVAAGVGGMTVKLEIRYAAPTPVHQELHLEARVEQSDERLVRMAGSIRHGETTTATATATFFRLTEDHARRLFPHLVRE